MTRTELEQVRDAFRTHEQMTQEYGESGSTCAEVLAAYQKQVDDCDAALAWLENCGDMQCVNPGSEAFTTLNLGDAFAREEAIRERSGDAGPTS